MISALVIMGATLAYILLRLHIEKRRGALKDADDAKMLNLLAFEREASVFDLFVLAGRRWSFSNSKIECDFNSYLNKGDIPYYVSQYVHRQHVDTLSYQSKLFVGHDLPPSASP